MAVKQNLQLIRARYRAVNAHDWNRFQGFYGRSIVWRDPGLRAPIKGPQAVRKRLEALAAAFPNLRWKLDRIFGQGNRVCAEFTFSGTHKGKLSAARGGKPISATNRSVRVRASGVYTIRNGKIVDSKIYFNFGNLVAQLQK